MNLYALIGLCFVPVVVLLSFFVFFVDSKRFYFYFISIALALVAVIPASFVQYCADKIPFFSANTFLSLLLGSLILNGLVEESVKFGFECLIPRKKMEFKMFFCCILLFGLTVGSFESIIYTLNRIQFDVSHMSQNAAVKLIFQRMISAQLIHLFCSALSGFFVWNLGSGFKKIHALVFAVLLHGMYDFFMSFGKHFRFFAVAAIVLALIEIRQFYKDTKSSGSDGGANE